MVGFDWNFCNQEFMNKIAICLPWFKKICYSNLFEIQVSSCSLSASSQLVPNMSSFLAVLLMESQAKWSGCDMSWRLFIKTWRKIDTWHARGCKLFVYRYISLYAHDQQINVCIYITHILLFLPGSVLEDPHGDMEVPVLYVKMLERYTATLSSCWQMKQHS